MKIFISFSKLLIFLIIPTGYFFTKEFLNEYNFSYFLLSLTSELILFAILKKSFISIIYKISNYIILTVILLAYYIQFYFILYVQSAEGLEIYRRFFYSQLDYENIDQNLLITYSIITTCLLFVFLLALNLFKYIFKDLNYKFDFDVYKIQKYKPIKLRKIKDYIVKNIFVITCLSFLSLFLVEYFKIGTIYYAENKLPFRLGGIIYLTLKLLPILYLRTYHLCLLYKINYLSKITIFLYAVYCFSCSFITTSRTYIFYFLFTIITYNLLINRFKIKNLILIVFSLFPIQILTLAITNLRSSNLLSQIKVITNESIFSLDYAETFFFLDNNIKFLFLIFSSLFRIQGSEPLMNVLSAKNEIMNVNFWDSLIGLNTRLTTFYTTNILNRDNFGTEFTPALIGSFFITAKNLLLVLVLFFIYLIFWQTLINFLSKLNLRSFVVILPFLYCLILLLSQGAFQVVGFLLTISQFLLFFIPIEIEFLKIERSMNS